MFSCQPENIGQGKEHAFLFLDKSVICIYLGKKNNMVVSKGLTDL